MKLEHLGIALVANHDEIRKLISQNTYNCHKCESEYKLAIDILSLQKVMLAKLVNPEMDLEINSKCTIEEGEQ